MATKILCRVESCACQKDGVCRHTTILLHPCSPDADNIVACSEYCEADEVEVEDDDEPEITLWIPRDRAEGENWMKNIMAANRRD